MRRNDVTSTSFRGRVPIRFLINQCQIITFLILKYDIIENSRIELIVLPVQMGGLLGGQRVCCPPPPPSQIIGGPGPPWPLSSYAYVRVEIELAVMFYNIYMSVDVETTLIVVGNTEKRGILAQFRLFSVFLNS